MQQIMRRLGCGAVVLLGAMVFLRASGALAVSIPTGVYTLPVPAGDTTTVDLGAPAPFPGTPQWLRLHKTSPTDTLVDYTAVVSGSGPSSGAGTPANASIYTLTFEVTWNGTIGELTPTDAFGPQLLFAILDSRFETGSGTGTDFASTYDLVQSGFVRQAAGGSFLVDGASVTPEIVRDDPDGGGFVADHYPGDWIGFYLDAEPGVTHTITLKWALGETPSGGDNVFFPNALFLATVPEPGTGVLVGFALLALGVARRARGRAA